MMAENANAVPHDTQPESDAPEPRPKRVRSPETVVRSLQARIVKATEQKRWRKVQSLQHLLTHSYSGRQLAVDRVTHNKGSKTPGVDGET
jgi:retron-type reverse transcriptase